jgi:hypothetical protein
MNVRPAVFTLAVLACCPAAALAQASPLPPAAPSFNVTAMTGLGIGHDTNPGFSLAAGVTPRKRAERDSVSVEVEFTRISDNPSKQVPAIVAISINFLIPVKIRHVRAYGLAGLGGYLLKSPYRTSEPDNAYNFGGGVLLPLAGPAKLRIDYRYFNLAPLEGEYQTKLHRLFLGVTAGF